MRYQPRPLLRNLSHAIESRLLFTPVQLLCSGHPPYQIHVQQACEAYELTRQHPEQFSTTAKSMNLDGPDIEVSISSLSGK